MVLSYIRAFKLSIRGSAKPPPEKSSVGIWQPLPDLKVERDPPLTEEEEAKVKELREWARSIQLDEGDDYAEWETRFLDGPGCMRRFLKAEDWKVAGAKKRLQSTLEWRRDYKPDLIPPSEIKEETEGGKIVVTGFALNGMPVIYLRPAKENTEPSPTQVRHMIFQLERAIDLMPEGVSKIAMVISFAGASAKSSPPMKITKSVITILQQHYCERLGAACVVSLPWYLKSFFATVSPFLDPSTRQKLKMNPDLKTIIPAAQLDAEYGGEYHFEYKHDVYLPAICKFCGIADDGTRTEHRPGPVRSGTAATAATDVTEASGVTGRDFGDRPALDTMSSHTAVSDHAPSRVGPKKDAPTPPRSPPEHRSRPRRHWYSMCFPSSSAHANYADRDDSDRRSAHSSISSAHSARSRLKRLGRKKDRTSATERNRQDAEVESITDPAETARLEQTFKDAEPKRVVRKDDPEIVHALEAEAMRDAQEQPMSLEPVATSPSLSTGGDGGPPSVGLPTTGATDAAAHALNLMRKATSSEAETRPVIRQPTHDRAYERPEALRAETVPEDELMFKVSSNE